MSKFLYKFSIFWSFILLQNIKQIFNYWYILVLLFEIMDILRGTHTTTIAYIFKTKEETILKATCQNFFTSFQYFLCGSVKMIWLWSTQLFFFFSNGFLVADIFHFYCPKILLCHALCVTHMILMKMAYRAYTHKLIKNIFMLRATHYTYNQIKWIPYLKI